MERPLLLVEGMLDLSPIEAFGLRRFPLKLEAPSFRAGWFTNEQDKYVRCAGAYTFSMLDESHRS